MNQEQFAETLKKAIEIIDANRGGKQIQQIYEELALSIKKTHWTIRKYSEHGKNIPKPKEVITLAQEIVKNNGFTKEDLKNFLSSADIQNISTHIKKIMPDQQIQTEEFNNFSEYYQYMTQKIIEATSSVDISRSAIGTDKVFTRYQTGNEYNKLLTKRIKEGLEVRRILVITTQEHLNWLKRLTEEHKNHPLYIGCFPKIRFQLPILNIVSIDKTEILINEDSTRNTVKTTNPQITSLMNDHINDLWEKSMKIKTKNGIDHELISLLEIALWQ